MDKFITKSSFETEKLGSEFARSLKPGDFVLLYGELGAGKTTFTKGVAKGLGVKERVISPTFVLHRIHRADLGKINKLNHLDLYRIEGKPSTQSLGLSEIAEEDSSVTLIEWANRLSSFIPKSGYKIYFKNIGDNKREIEFKTF